MLSFLCLLSALAALWYFWPKVKLWAAPAVAEIEADVKVGVSKPAPAPLVVAPAAKPSADTKPAG